MQKQDQATHNNNMWLRLGLLVAVAGAFWLRCHELGRQDIWWDEARNIDVALRPFMQIALAPELDIHPPIYFWTLHFWSRIGGLNTDNDPTLVAYYTRFLSVWLGTLAVALVAALSKRFAGSVSALLAGLLVAVSPFWLAESQETRMYSLEFAVLTAAALALFQGLEGSPSGSRTKANHWASWATFILLSAVALISHYNAAFVLLAWYVWWMGWSLFQPDRFHRLRTMLICGVATSLLVVPVLPIALRQIPDYANPNLTVPSPTSYLVQNWQAYWAGYAYEAASLWSWSVATTVLLQFRISDHTPNLWLWLTATLLIVGLLLAIMPLFRPAMALNRDGLSFLVVWLLGGLSLYYIAVLDRGAFNVRYSSFVTPALYTLAGLAMAGWFRLSRLAGLVITVFVFLTLAPAVYADYYDESVAREDMESVANWLRDRAGPNDVIFVDQKYPFGFYYGRYAIDSSIEPEGPEAAPARYLFVDINTIDRQLTEWAGRAEHVYWVQWFESDTDPRRAVAYLLDKAGERTGEEWFRGYSIDWWTLDPPTKFELAPNMAPISVAYTSAVEVVEASLPVGGIAAGDGVPITLRWRRVPNGTVIRPLKARIALYNQEGGRMAQIDKRILNDRHLLPQEWQEDDRPLNVYLVETPADLAPGTYDVGLIVYDAETLEPLALADSASGRDPVEANLGTITIDAPSE